MKHLILASAIMLSACGPKEIPVAILPPIELTTCDDMPTAPELATVDWSSVQSAQPIQRARDTAMLAYVLALRTAYGSCRGDVDGLAKYIETVSR